ncbi:MAG: arylsulfatase [Bacteroidales bacterium]|nr:arylsulfatase [Bacteroidales bacterium]
MMDFNCRQGYFRAGFMLAGLSLISMTYGQAPKHPNVVLILTDDQGYGDFGFAGNPHVKTPCLDKLAAESIKFNNFYVSPVSAPTRSSLMTGRYSLRTGVRDTNNGGAIMASSEVTIAEVLKGAGYATGQFGKWHLGDNYPCRPVDQGFDESLMHLGGGMGQPGDITTYLRGDSSYFNPVLWHNGLRESYSGYCSDIFTDQAIRFIERNTSSPFFCYLAFNAPHTPLQVPENYYNMYRDIDPSLGFENDIRPFPEMSEKDKEDARKVYAMMSNIDDNISRVLKKLDDLGISDSTVVIFMTDNGPQQRRYIAGMRGLKGSVYRGGVRVPLLIRHPGAGKGIKEIQEAVAHIDLLPTIASFCEASLPGDRKIDGIDIKPLITGTRSELSELSKRSLFFYWTRHSPELYNNIALQIGRYRLVGNIGYNAISGMFELFDIKTDPYERRNIVADQPQVAAELKAQLDRNFRELVTSVNMTEKQYINVGTANENPVILNRNDADGQWGVWEQEEAYGTWRVTISEGTYNMSFRFLKPLPGGGRMMVETGSVINQIKNDIPDASFLEMKNVFINSVRCDFTPFYLYGNRRILPLWVEIERIK